MFLASEVLEASREPEPRHHVIQSILEHGQERHKHVIAQTLTSDALNFAQHRNLGLEIIRCHGSCFALFRLVWDSHIGILANIPYQRKETRLRDT